MSTRNSTIERADGSTVSIEMVDVATAEEWLSLNDANRRLSNPLVDSIARQMGSGDWKFAGDPVRFSKDGRLIDGQHRLEAIRTSGLPAEILVIRGLDDGVQAVIDSGRKRSATDVLGMDSIPHASIAAATVRLLLSWEAGTVLRGNTVIGNQEILSFVRDHSESITAAVQIGNAARGALPVSAANVAAVYFRVAAIADPDIVSEFFTKLIEGTDLKQGDPVLALRNSVIRRKEQSIKTSRNETLYYLLRAWNGYVKGEHLVKLQLPRYGLNLRTFPEPIAQVGDSEISPAAIAAEEEALDGAVKA